jgi:hypothetical protein
MKLSASCSSCEGALEIAKDGVLCYSCLFATLNKELQEIVDESLYSRVFLVGIKQLKDSLGIGLGESTFMYSWRYHQLRQLKPERFPYPDKEYWKT